MRKTVVIGIVLICFMLFGIVYTAIPYVTIKNQGRIFVSGLDCDTSIIDWGTIEPNGVATHTINVCVKGNAPATLTFNTSNWNPPDASSVITLTWNYSGDVLQPNIWTPIELSLSVSPDISGITQFSFDVLVATEVNY